MAKSDAKVRCQTPTKGKSAKNIPKWKYDLVRAVIRRVVPKNATGVEFRELPALVAQELSPTERQELGVIPWYTTTVKLHLEVIGELERVPDTKPQRLRRLK